ncbi:hypothetical protein VMCG_02396 [Cytospora schulzeri]|uniref:WSC domain-containing protein n=1 Tax=Cytospora schulzeri TaxID=448051 RepID=A0A423X0R5_9PEZI|nr:hypothetical protein VMCG_02396 [Valsa malicola]
MERHTRSGVTAALMTIFLGFAAAEPSRPVAYCASINTGETSANSSIYQSEGLCYDLCDDQGYALGILQDSNCWCSNYLPDTGDQVDTSECSSKCPGYPTDYCGGDNLYGYISLSASPKGTQGGTTSSTSTKSKPEAAKTTSDKNTGGTPTTITSIQTVTSEGSIVIQTITTISTPSANQGSGNLSKGAVAGLTVGILAAVAAFVAGAFLFRRHKRRMQPEGSMGAGGIDRQGSSAGIMSKAGTISSAGYGLAMEEDGSYGGRRMSMKPMDPRLDPKVGLYRIASHDSLNTIRDDQDYSRRVHESPRIMRVTNPDPDPAD